MEEEALFKCHLCQVSVYVGIRQQALSTGVCLQEKFKEAAECIKYHLLVEEASNTCEMYSWFS